MAENKLEFKNICKYFLGVKAIDDVSFTAQGGEIHALIGENGAGKSTLMKLLGGIYPPTKGEIFVNGEKKEFKKAADSIHSGIAIIHQELQLVEQLTIAENIFIGRMHTKKGIVQWKTMFAEAQKILDYLKQPLKSNMPVHKLSIGQKQMVEIAKAISLNANIIAFDEPTSSLSENETKILFSVIRELKKQNKIIFYISHRMAEIFLLSDVCTIMKDGKKVETYKDLNKIDKNNLIMAMTGREIHDVYSFQSHKKEEVFFEVKNLRGNAIKDEISFVSKQGEILGFFGLVGSGRSELMRVIYGADKKQGGDIVIHGKKFRSGTIHNSIKQGLVLLSEDRKKDGIISLRSIMENVMISSRRHISLFGKIINYPMERKITQEQIDILHIKAASIYQNIENLSGGNQQKVLLGRWLSEKDIKVLIIDEPTRGIDVSAKNEIYQILYELAKKDISIIVVSSELPEVMGITDRLYVMREGEISKEFERHEYDENQILSFAFPKF